MTKVQELEEKVESLRFMFLQLVGDLSMTESLPDWKRDLFYEKLKKIEKDSK